MKNLSNSIFSPSSCRYWSRIYAWFAWFGLDSHVLPRCFSMQLSPTTWVSQLQREVQNIGFLKLCFFRCASISWFQAVSGSVIYRFQLAHLRVFQIIKRKKASPYEIYPYVQATRSTCMLELIKSHLVVKCQATYLDKEEPAATACFPCHLKKSSKRFSKIWSEFCHWHLQKESLLLKPDPLKPPHKVLTLIAQTLSILVHHVGEPGVSLFDRWH